jgi:hypothetical protein
MPGVKASIFKGLAKEALLRRSEIVTIDAPTCYSRIDLKTTYRNRYDISQAPGSVS